MIFSSASHYVSEPENILKIGLRVNFSTDWIFTLNYQAAVQTVKYLGY
jgi:hypothetical protein